MDVVHALWDAGFKWDVKHNGAPPYTIVGRRLRPSDSELQFVRELQKYAIRQYSMALSAEGRAAAKQHWRKMLRSIGKQVV